MTDALTRKKSTRFRILKAVYDKTDGHPQAMVNVFEVAAEIGLGRQETDAAAQYLSNEGLLKFRAMGGKVGISHEGVIEIENSISKPGEASQYFPAYNIINITNMMNSQIQQGSVNSTQVQTNSSTELSEALEQLLTALRSENLSDEKIESIEISKEVLLHQAKLPRDHRDETLIKKAWDKFSKLNTAVSLGKNAYLAYQIAAPLIKSYFGI